MSWWVTRVNACPVPTEPSVSVMDREQWLATVLRHCLLPHPSPRAVSLGERRCFAVVIKVDSSRVSGSRFAPNTITLFNFCVCNYYYYSSASATAPNIFDLFNSLEKSQDLPNSLTSLALSTKPVASSSSEAGESGSSSMQRPWNGGPCYWHRITTSRGRSLAV